MALRPPAGCSCLPGNGGSSGSAGHPRTARLDAQDTLLRSRERVADVHRFSQQRQAGTPRPVHGSRPAVGFRQQTRGIRRAALGTSRPRSRQPGGDYDSASGRGGFGKTTLAVALCHDDDIITAFDDGVLWATLGEAPKIQHELTKLYAALTGERPSFLDIDDAAIQLAERLDEKNYLIVIDDVWDPNH